MGLRICLIANFAVPWTTGNDLVDTLERLGCSVTALQEQDRAGWGSLVQALRAGDGPDAVVWNRTPTLSAVVDLNTRTDMLTSAARAGVPTIAFHLDRWWGLKREKEVYVDPYFRCSYVFTADGHDPKRWKAAGVNHFWSPPAIAERNCVLKTPLVPIRSEIAFIGSWMGYHREWGHREDLVRWLKKYFGKMVTVLPLRGRPQLREEALNAQIAATKVIVGDSCLVPDDNGPWTRYCSDRLFEIPGRGGFLVHPGVQGVCWFPSDYNLLVPGTHLASWTLGDWEGMRRQITHYLEHEGERRQIADAGAAHIRAHHTYGHRMRAVFDAVGLDLG